MALILALLISGVAGAAEDNNLPGLLRTPNHHPLYVGLLYPPPEVAAPVFKTRWSVSLNHTNVYMIGAKGNWAVAVDKEMTELELSAAYPLSGGRLEAGGAACLYNSSGGFLDGFVRWYHGRIGVSGYSGQTKAPDDRYWDYVYHDGERVSEGREGAMLLGDTDLWLKASLIKADGFDLSAQALAQAPTGGADRGAGSGAWEWGLRAMMSADMDPVTLHLGAGAAIPGQIKRTKDTASLNAIYSGFLGATYRAGARLWIVAQSMFNTSPLQEADIYVFRDPWWEATIGLKTRLKNGRVVGVGLSENLNRTGPDFTIHLSIGN